MQRRFAPDRIAILGGGPGGYEAAMVAADAGAEVTIIEEKGLGGSAVLTDVVPSKTLIATADAMRRVNISTAFGVRFGEHASGTEGAAGDEAKEAEAWADFSKVNERLLKLAHSQSRDIHATLESYGVRVIIGRGKLVPPHSIEVTSGEHAGDVVVADAIIVATGAHPRELGSAKPDGERILNWTQAYNLTEVPEHMIVVGSGVTGAEFASAYRRLGAEVTLVSSRDQVLPGEDADAATVLENSFKRVGVHVASRTRAESVERTEDGVDVRLTNGEVLHGSHCLMAVGGIPNTADLGLEEAGVEISESGHVQVDTVSRTTANNIYAAGDCTGVMPLASVAAMQGRVAVAHMQGESVKPLKLHQVASNVFTSPEIATVGVTQEQVDSGKYQADVIKLDLATNARAKMMNIREGFVKIFSRKGSGTVIGAVVVAPRASELIFPLALAVTHKLHVDDVATTFTVYPSLTGSISEAARRLHLHVTDPED
ncbi:NAD(P)H-quinone dehydrogenase [Nesterenkonia sp. LB17]|uniref:NAD(P)H-quinone dehydrogenase n=1 Tax=unclassified Nesterenkonia TaxID=2629769 RepID=UPI001F4CEA82|nr:MULTISPECIES: NAD(P)H-quinone dehydrogenase [unclassified Nesterenkonia]MCH8561403.1 NAD(P)H-quinone dehydrogenase [Nesterenkonia sp. DZ6]MCH8566442.1 NAD(P)H-quinone dehydrogenase [Nesterenkonia sp. LB17]